MEGNLSNDSLTCEIIIGKSGTEVNLKGHAPNSVARVYLYAEKKSDLHLLSQYPNIERLFLAGKISEVDSLLGLKQLKELELISFSGADFSGLNFSGLEELPLEKIRMINCGVSETFSALLSGNVQYLHLDNIKKMEDLALVEKATGLKKLCIENIPWVDKLPDFSKLKNLYALKLYGLHKLNNIENLAVSNIEYLACALVADNLSGTKLAETLLRMKVLKQADMSLIDRHDRRYNVLKNRLAKEGKEDLLTTLDYKEWMEL